ncbi:hypothetical protein F5Y17DRAFT_432796 [Xylariaceae sp. FL0594]|nr:hypothetical protein F5Y17DRAFT_432796 [Xylariaceae sp. FL0594]
MASISGRHEPDVLFDKGIGFYSTHQLRKALCTFALIAKTCQCGVYFKDEPCVCKSVLAAIEKSDLEGELRKPCRCPAKSSTGSTRCKNALHIQALDYVASMYKALERPSKAFRVAESMINLSPRDPRGFLRLASLLCKQGDFAMGSLTLQQGIELVSKKYPSHELLPKLHRLKDKAVWRARASDPLRKLPIEIAAMIFSYVDFATMCKCLRVCKSWKLFLTRSDATIASLWRVQRFGPCRRPVSVTALSRYDTYAGRRVRELDIADPAGFGMGANELKWIARKCTTLESLIFRSMKRSEQIFLDDDSHETTLGPASLSCLYIGYFVPFYASFVSNLLLRSAETLEHLTLLNLPIRGGPFTDVPMLRHLRTLHLGTELTIGAKVDMVSVIQSTPNLEELWLQNVKDYSMPGAEISADSPIWPRMKRLRLKDMPEPISLLRFCPLFRLSSNLEELVINDEETATALLQDPYISDASSYPRPENIRVFKTPDLQENTLLETRAWAAAFSECLENWMRPSLESGSLEQLHLGEFPLPLPDWFRSDQVSYLSVRDILRCLSGDSLDDFMSEISERFPNIESLDIGEVSFSPGALGRIIEKGVVKTIYCRRPYSDMAELVDWARETHGTSFSWLVPPLERGPPPV